MQVLTVTIDYVALIEVSRTEDCEVSWQMLCSRAADRHHHQDFQVLTSNKADIVRSKLGHLLDPWARNIVMMALSETSHLG